MRGSSLPKNVRLAAASLKPVRQTTQYNCMSASMSMALMALGVNPKECGIDLVNEVMGARPMRGAAWEQALACAQHYGTRGTLVCPSTVSQLKEWTDSGKPVMISWNPEGRDWSHASVVFDVVEDPNHGFLVHVADPNIPDPDETVRIVPKAEFYSKWYEKWPNYMVRRPAMMLDREVTPDGRQVMAFSNRTASDLKEDKMLNPSPSASKVALRFAADKAKDISKGLLSKELSRSINKALVHNGLDGNGRFGKPEKAYSMAVDIIGDFGLELDTVVSSHLFKARPTGTITVQVAFKNPEDSFSPIPISNSVLYIQFTELRKDVFEAVAYMS